MKTDCTCSQLEFQGLGKQKILVKNSGGETSTDGGVEVMNWCEINKVFYVLGMSRNKRLVSCISAELAQAKKMQEETGHSARVFTLPI